jgi:hypothetical protein
MTDLRAALGSLEDEVVSDEVDGLTLWSAASDRGRRASAARGVHLLQNYDELVVGYTESRFHGETSGDLARQAWSDRTYPTGVFLLHGRVGGHWRRTIEAKRVRVSIHTYGAPGTADARTLESAAKRLGRFLELPATVDISRFRPP